jgi:hypothetical protein
MFPIRFWPLTYEYWPDLYWQAYYVYVPPTGRRWKIMPFEPFRRFDVW